ncbi:MAG: hypothetical protein DYG89_18030 [Caldilinea sp. CFX5]|nr:hypothetical protein [Caldilinea sp. CFX5]
MAPATSRSATATTASGAAAVQVRTAPHDAGQATTTVQRQLTVPSLADAAAAAVNTIVPAVTAPGSPAAPPAQPKLDTDDLARQVYAELKRKLAVERERLRLG